MNLTLQATYSRRGFEDWSAEVEPTLGPAAAGVALTFKTLDDAPLEVRRWVHQLGMHGSG
jgi:hypothetical protein